MGTLGQRHGNLRAEVDPGQQTTLQWGEEAWGTPTATMGDCIVVGDALDWLSSSTPCQEFIVFMIMSLEPGLWAGLNKPLLRWIYDAFCIILTVTPLGTY